MGKKVISFAVWGKNPLYTRGALYNAQRAKEFYPDWTCKFYYASVGELALDPEIVEQLKATGAEVQPMGEAYDALGMYWRFRPMFDDPAVERFIVRDTDSFFSLREANAVGDWIDSGKPFHVIRDCESHQTEILGGTWGAVPGCVDNFRLRMEAWCAHLQPDFKNPRGLFHGSDQVFLGRVVWPVIKNNHLAHIRAGEDMKHLRYTPADVELPPLGDDKHYVGMVYNIPV